MEVKINGYSIISRELTEEEGGGIFIEVPALPGCASDGETWNEALIDIKQAIKCWIDCAKERGKKIPKPY